MTFYTNGKNNPLAEVEFMHSRPKNRFEDLRYNAVVLWYTKRYERSHKRVPAFDNYGEVESS